MSFWKLQKVFCDGYFVVGDRVYSLYSIKIIMSMESRHKHEHPTCVCVSVHDTRCWVFSSLGLSSPLAFCELLFPSINHWANLFSHGPADREGLLLQYWCSRSPLQARALLYPSLPLSRSLFHPYISPRHERLDQTCNIVQWGTPGVCVCENVGLLRVIDSQSHGLDLQCQTHGWPWGRQWCDGQKLLAFTQLVVIARALAHHLVTHKHTSVHCQAAKEQDQPTAKTFSTRILH